MINFKYLPAFLYLAENLSFSQTSERLHIAQSAVSRQIKLLEEQLSTPLFFRDKHKVQLTPQGQEFFNEVKHHYRAIEDLAAKTVADSKEIRGEINIGLLPEVGQSLFFSLITQFKMKFPKIIPKIIYITHKDIQKKLEAGELDFGISAQASEQENFRSYPIYEETIVIVNRHGCKSLKEAGTQATFVGYKERDKLLDLFSKSILGRTKKTNFSLIVNSHRSMVEYLIQSDDYAAIPLHVAEPYIKKKKLQLASPHKIKNKIYLTSRDYTHSHQKLIEFRKFILKGRLK